MLNSSSRGVFQRVWVLKNICRYYHCCCCVVVIIVVVIANVIEQKKQKQKTMFSEIWCYLLFFFVHCVAM